VVHVLIASFLFLLIAGAAVLIWEFTNWIKALGAPYEIWVPCHAVADLIFFTDVICASFLVVVEGWRLIRKIVASGREL
jgi:hypothetical protein